MADTEDDRTLSEIVVMELVEQGLDSSMRESILDAVEESEGASTDGSRSLPLAGALFGLGAAIGFLAGRESGELEDVSMEDIEEPEIIEDLTGEAEAEAEADDDTEADEADVDADEVDEGDDDTEAEEGGSSGILGRLVLALGAIAIVVFLRQKLAGGDDEEWEPIEEFEPATELDAEETDDEDDEDDEDVEDVETVEDLEESNE